VIAKILVAEGTDNVKVGTVIAVLAEEGESADKVTASAKADTPAPAAPKNETLKQEAPAESRPAEAAAAPQSKAPAVGDRVKASPLARRIAAEKGIEISALTGTGPNGRIVKADVEGAKPGAAPTAKAEAPTAEAAVHKPVAIPDIPHEATKLSNSRSISVSTRC
jgi:pyruvate dehydrogenase E2 component (dihydrolipoamide acetyltransferase)